MGEKQNSSRRRSTFYRVQIYQPERLIWVDEEREFDLLREAQARVVDLRGVAARVVAVRGKDRQILT